MKQQLLLVFILAHLFVAAQPADSTAVARQVDSLLQAAIPLIGQFNFDEATPLVEAAKKLAMEKFGANHPVYASCIFQRGCIFHNKNNATQAERDYLETKAILAKTLGTEDLEYASVLLNLGMLYVNDGRFPEAEQPYLEVKSIREKKLGKEHLDYAAILANLGILYVNLKRLAEAEAHHLEAKAIRERLLGTNHALYINSLNNLGRVCWDAGRYEEAEANYLAVKAWRGKNLSMKHFQYAHILSNLGDFYNDIGRYEEAERHFTEVLSIQQISPGEESADYARTLNLLGRLYKNMGLYEEAEQYLIEAKTRIGGISGTGNIDYVRVLDDLAALSSQLGRYEDASALYIEAQAILEKLSGRNSIEAASRLNNQAVLQENMGRLPAADSLYRQAKKIIGEQVGKGSLEYAQCLHNLGVLHTEMGRFAAADTFLLEAKSIRLKLVGKEHLAYAHSLEDLALLREKTGKPEEAFQLQSQAKIIFEKSLGKEHFENVKCLQILARLSKKLKKPETKTYFLEANALQRNLLTRSTRYASEREMASFASLYAHDIDEFYAFAQDGQLASPDLPAVCFDNALFYKGFLLTAAGRVRNIARSDTLLAKRMERLISLHRMLAAELAKPVAEREKVQALESQANELEKELTRTAASVGEGFVQIGWKEVQAKLRPGEAAIEFIHFRNAAASSGDSISYAALVLLSGNAPPRFVPLFEEKSLDSLVRVNGRRRGDYVQDLYSANSRGFTPAGKKQKTLYELIWQPLKNTVAGVKTIYFSPTGLLHRLNLDAISIKGKTVLADSFRLVELGSTRQLALPSTFQPANADAQLFGGIRYEMDSLAIDSANASFSANALALLRDMGFSADSTLRSDGGGWSYLEGTKEEIVMLQEILKQNGFHPTVRQGFAGTEEAFKSIEKNLPSPRVLHLATHGFFSSDPKTAKAGQLAQSAEGQTAFKISEHPMIRSGLLLAGASHAWQTGKALHPEGEDGVLTAYEISQMNLSNTELVVLSACETGLGDIQGNEGVYGLQRAFKIAGVKYIIMSLWEVSDEKTPKLMEPFYHNWLVEKMSIPDAFRAAQKHLRKDKDYGAFEWAGFVLVE